MKEADSEANPLGCPVLHRIAHIVTNLIGEVELWKQEALAYFQRNLVKCKV